MVEDIQNMALLERIESLYETEDHNLSRAWLEGSAPLSFQVHRWLWLSR